MIEQYQCPHPERVVPTSARSHYHSRFTHAPAASAPPPPLCIDMQAGLGSIIHKPPLQVSSYLSLEPRLSSGQPSPHTPYPHPIRFLQHSTQTILPPSSILTSPSCPFACIHLQAVLPPVAGNRSLLVSDYLLLLEPRLSSASALASATALQYFGLLLLPRGPEDANVLP